MLATDMVIHVYYNDYFRIIPQLISHAPLPLHCIWLKKYHGFQSAETTRKKSLSNRFKCNKELLILTFQMQISSVTHCYPQMLPNYHPDQSIMFTVILPLNEKDVSDGVCNNYFQTTNTLSQQFLPKLCTQKQNLFIFTEDIQNLANGLQPHYQTCCFLQSFLSHSFFRITTT